MDFGPQEWLLATMCLSPKQEGLLIEEIYVAAEDGDVAFLSQFPFIRNIRLKRTTRTKYLSVDTRRAVIERDGGRCAACGTTEDLQFDHVVAVVHGGGDETENIQLLCRRCNRAKGPAPWERRRLASKRGAAA